MHIYYMQKVLANMFITKLKWKRIRSTNELILI
jgi:hypothetical protein